MVYELTGIKMDQLLMLSLLVRDKYEYIETSLVPYM
jgi:hypothetical protein